MILNKKITCCFAGHRHIYDSDLKTKMKKLIVSLIENGASVFLVGNYGDFDRLSSSVVRSLKENYPFIQLNLVIPYLTKEIISQKEWYESRYDHILLSEIKENTPRHLRIIKGNESMVNQSDILISYVLHSTGGANKTLSYAKKKKLIIYNLADS